MLPTTTMALNKPTCGTFRHLHALNTTRIHLIHHHHHHHHRRPHFRTISSSASNNDIPIASTVTTDSSVPEGHKGLHSFLYGDDTTIDPHATSPRSSQDEPSDQQQRPFSFHDGEDDGTAIMPVPAYLSSRNKERPVGVFAMYDAKRILQYVGYSRNVVLSVRTLLDRVGEDRCAFVRVMVFANKAMQSRAALQQEADNWLREAGGTLPPGNGIDEDLWSGEGVLSLSSMSADEREEYEEKKIKMRKAMGEVKKDGEGEELSLAQRGEKMRNAMEQGDWSEVINAQTEETLQNGGSTTTTPTTPPPITTPFARASVHRSVGNEDSSAQHKEMTVDAVDKALDDVRPYLIADGGNVSVVGVENGIVALELEGACGTCPSSTSTMKMGIERALRAAFGDQVKEVVAVGGGGGGDPVATVESVDMHLNMLRGAISAYGGGVEVLEVAGGRATLKYGGPKPIGYGMVAAIKDKFRDLNDVVLLDADTGNVIEF